MPAIKFLNRWSVGSRCALVVFWAVTCLAVFTPQAAAGGDAPQWLHALTGAQLPAYDEKTDAVLLYSETNVTVFSADKIRTHILEAYKILRPEGRELGTLSVYFNPRRKISNLRGWCIPQQGKDYEVKEKDAIDVAAPFDGGELISDIKYRVLRIPAADPEVSLDMNTTSRSSLSGYRIRGPSRKPIPFVKATFHCSFPPAGNTKLHGPPIRKRSPLQAQGMHCNGRSVM